VFLFYEEVFEIIYSQEALQERPIIEIGPTIFDFLNAVIFIFIFAFPNHLLVNLLLDIG